MIELKMTPPDSIGEDGKVVPSQFSGYVKIKIPRYKERIKRLREMGLQGEDGKLEASMADRVSQAEKMLDLVEEHVTEVKLEVIATKRKIGSLEELEIYKEGAEFINKIGGAILGGVEMGNVLNQPSSSKSTGAQTA